MHEVLAIIPARQGSKTLPHKNLRLLGGKPLLAYSIEHARQSNTVTRTIVSTDSEDYAAISRDYGAETPFLRPRAIAGDEPNSLRTFLRRARAVMRGWLAKRAT